MWRIKGGVGPNVSQAPVLNNVLSICLIGEIFRFYFVYVLEYCDKTCMFIIYGSATGRTEFDPNTINIGCELNK